MMDRLTTSTKFPLTTFNRCQICGKEDSDICAFRMYWECDDADKPEPYNVIVVCRGKRCKKTLQAHPRLYHELPWGQGEPGHFMLLCGPCKYRNGTHCTHPHLKANGGEGLLLHKFSVLKATVCYHDSSREDGGLRCDPEGFPAPFSQCEGAEETGHG